MRTPFPQWYLVPAEAGFRRETQGAALIHKDRPGVRGASPVIAGQVIGVVALHHHFFQHAWNGELAHDVAVFINERKQTFHHVLERVAGVFGQAGARTGGVCRCGNLLHVAGVALVQTLNGVFPNGDDGRGRGGLDGLRESGRGRGRIGLPGGQQVHAGRAALQVHAGALQKILPYRLHLAFITGQVGENTAALHKAKDQHHKRRNQRGHACGANRRTLGTLRCRRRGRSTSGQVRSRNAGVRIPPRRGMRMCGRRKRVPQRRRGHFKELFLNRRRIPPSAKRHPISSAGSG